VAASHPLRQCWSCDLSRPRQPFGSAETALAELAELSARGCVTRSIRIASESEAHRKLETAQTGVKLAGLYISDRDQEAEDFGVLLCGYLTRLLHKSDVLVRTGTPGNFLCELGGHEMDSRDRKKPPFGKPNHTGETMVQLS
jgi:hypothetical protein